MTQVLLVRHGSIDALGVSLAGRSDGVHLNARGRHEARRLAAWLARHQIASIYSSPRERAVETALVLGEARALTPQTCGNLDEIDFGDWTGATFDALADDAGWRVWVDRRSAARPPHGETIVDVQRRIVAAIDALSARHCDQTIVLVSHGDVIKSAIAHYLGVSLDRLESFEIAPASVSVLGCGPAWAVVRALNHTPDR